MGEELNYPKSMSVGLNLIGLAMSLAAIMSTGVMAVIAGSLAVAFLFGSLAVSLIPAEPACERRDRECRVASAYASAEPDIGPAQEAGQSHHWRQSVAASRCGSRRL